MSTHSFVVQFAIIPSHPQLTCPMYLLYHTVHEPYKAM